MTISTVHQGRRVRLPGAPLLALAVMVGSIAGSAATLQLIDWNAASLAGAGAAAGADTTHSGPHSHLDRRRPASPNSSTTAGEQYLDWYTRGARSSTPSTTAGRQYVDWYTRDSRPR